MPVENALADTGVTGLRIAKEQEMGLTVWAGVSYRGLDTDGSWSTNVRETMMFKRIDHVEVVTDQPDRTVQFYTEVLGFTVKSRDRIERSGLGVPIDLVYLDPGWYRRRADLVRGRLGRPGFTEGASRVPDDRV